MLNAEQYVGGITSTVKSFWHGMSVTLSYMFRKPITIQYQGPGRPIRGTNLRVVDMIPARYRGFLEVDMAICTGCQACERACPIDVINIDIVKDAVDPKKKFMERFDIDIGKCMFCGLCVEPCPTGAIQHSREFEGAVMNFNNLTFRFVPEGTLAPFYKPPKGVDAFPRAPTGSILAKTLRLWDAPPPPFPAEAPAAAAPAATPTTTSAAAPAAPVGPPLAQTATKEELYKAVRDAMADTDCGDCEYPTCDAYSKAIVYEGQTELHRCAPGGEETKAKLYQLFGRKPD